MQGLGSGSGRGVRLLLVTMVARAWRIPPEQGGDAPQMRSVEGVSGFRCWVLGVSLLAKIAHVIIQPPARDEPDREVIVIYQNESDSALV